MKKRGHGRRVAGVSEEGNRLRGQQGGRGGAVRASSFTAATLPTERRGLGFPTD